MLVLGKKSLIRKLVILNLVFVVFALFFTVLKRIELNVDAITGDGANVKITRDWVDGVQQRIYYSASNHSTVRFFVESGNNTMLAFCRNPSKIGPDKTPGESSSPTDYAIVPAKKMPNNDLTQNAIKLLVYLGSVNNTLTANKLNELFQGRTSDPMERYGFLHTSIGFLQEGTSDFNELTSADRPFVESIANSAIAMVQNDDDVWADAKTYQLYGLDLVAGGYDPDVFQDIVWVEKNSMYGNITIKKCDAEIGCTPQGNANFSGIAFEVYNNSGSKIYYNDTIYPTYNPSSTNTPIASGTTNAQGTLTFSNLPVGSYIVREIRTNASYLLTDSSNHTITINQNSTTEAIFQNRVKKGNIIVHKQDAETNLCSSQGGAASLTGTIFTVYNNNGKAIRVGNATIESGGVVAEKAIDGNCEATFNNIPYGSYKVVETMATTGYIRNNSEWQVSINSGTVQSPQIISITASNQIKRGDVKFRKIDDETNSGIPNIPFRITSKTTGENHIVVTNGDGVVDTSRDFILHSNNTNGYDGDNTSFITFRSYGTWFSGNLSGTNVDDNLGALPYDDYTIVELECDNNHYCYDISAELQDFSIEEDGVVLDLGDWMNDCASFTLSTIAIDNEDGDKFIEAKEEVTIKDEISYQLMKGKTYRIRGEIVDKSTGETLKIGATKVKEATDRFTPTSETGTMTMLFTFDASNLSGKTLVVYERLYEVDNNAEKLVAEHAELLDENQSINVISYSTTASDDADGDKIIEYGKTVKIKDEISYCLVEGQTYTIKGILMDKATGQRVLINNKPIEESITVTPTADNCCGRATMTYILDTTDLSGKDIVIYDEIYLGDTLILSHADINNIDETVKVKEPETPDTGRFIGNEKATSQDYIYQILVITPISLVTVYIIKRIKSHKNIVKFH